MPEQSGPSDGMWSVDHPVLDALRERRRAKSQPGQRADDHKIGLAVEGGGMRGVVSGAMLAALEEFGFGSAFDALYGCSGGAINSAYFVAGEAWRALPIYFQDLPSRDFLRLGRFLRGGSALDLAVVFDEIMEQVRPLHYDRVLSSPVPLTVALTMVDTIQPYAATDFTTREDLKAALMSTSWRPVLVRGAGVYRGERAIDGSVLTSLPYRMAVDDNCTHVLSLSTFPAGSYQARPSPFIRLTARHVERLRKGLGAAYLAEVARKHSDLQRLARLRHEPGAERPYVLDLAPMAGQPTLARWELRPRPLLAAITSAYEMVYAAVEGLPSSTIGTGAFTALPRWTVVRP
ncbi:patatin-like phospholipase family protein [Plantactinospora sp. B6F1]|uniref:patatin-like phospholipase family protein n=1 Tax=Plantactinospora sp. B6F1 TaxID=3158971 RepID=UPI0032D931CB